MSQELTNAACWLILIVLALGSAGYWSWYWFVCDRARRAEETLRRSEVDEQLERLFW